MLGPRSAAAARRGRPENFPRSARPRGPGRGLRAREAGAPGQWRVGARGRCGSARAGWVGVAARSPVCRLVYFARGRRSPRHPLPNFERLSRVASPTEIDLPPSLTLSGWAPSPALRCPARSCPLYRASERASAGLRGARRDTPSTSGAGPHPLCPLLSTPTSFRAVNSASPHWWPPTLLGAGTVGMGGARGGPGWGVCHVQTI